MNVRGFLISILVFAIQSLASFALANEPPVAIATADKMTITGGDGNTVAMTGTGVNPASSKILYTNHADCCDLTNIPLLIDGSVMDANFWRDVEPNGADIWVEYGGVEITKRELVLDSSGVIDVNQHKLELWILAPVTSSTTDLAYTFHWGDWSLVKANDNSVWDVNTRMVLHTGQSATGTAPQLTDSTSNANSLTASAGWASAPWTGIVNGKIGLATDFNALGNFTNTGPNNLSNATITGATMSFWADINTTSSASPYMSAKGDAAMRIYYDSDFNFAGKISGADSFGNKILTGLPDYRNQWTHYSMAWNNTSDTIAMYINGTNVGTLVNETNSWPTTGTLSIGQTSDFKGPVDEVRISDIDRGAGWIYTSYKNQNDNAHFWQTGPPKSWMIKCNAIDVNQKDAGWCVVGDNNEVLYDGFWAGKNWAHCAYKIFVSADGNNWTNAGNNAAKPIQNIWGTSNGNIIVATAPSGVQIWYGTEVNNVLTITRSHLAGVNMNMGKRAYTDARNLIETSAGTLILTEYGTPSAGSKIYRSTDSGANWTDVNTNSSIGHYHAGVENLATGRIIWATGDNIAQSKLVYSDDDGETWANLTATGTLAIKPLAFLDVGLPTQVLAGDESAMTLGLVDVTTGACESVYNDNDRRMGHNFVWSMTKDANGVIYAGSYVGFGATSDRQPAILASKDLYHWIPVYYIKNANAQGASLLAYDPTNDKIRGQIIAGVTHRDYLTLAPVTLTDCETLLLEPAVTNMLNGPSRSSAEDSSFSDWDTDWRGVFATKQRLSDEDGYVIPDGNYAVRFYRTDQNTMSNYIGKDGYSIFGVPATAGHYYSGGVWATAGSKQQSVLIQAVTQTGTTAANTQANYYVLDPNVWTWLDFGVCQLAADENHIGIIITTANGTGGNDANIVVDKAMIVEGQLSDWQVGGNSRAATLYDVSHVVPDWWSENFTWYPAMRSGDYDLINQHFYIRSWKKDSNNNLQLYYDSNDQKFKLDVDGDTGGQETLYTAACQFYKNAPVTFTIKVGGASDANVNCLVVNGAAVETMTRDGTNAGTAAGFAELGGTTITFRYGDEDAANMMAGRFFSNGGSNIEDLDMFCEQWLKDVDCFGQPGCPDLTHDDYVNFADYAELMRDWGI